MILMQLGKQFKSPTKIINRTIVHSQSEAPGQLPFVTKLNSQSHLTLLLVEPNLANMSVCKVHFYGARG